MRTSAAEGALPVLLEQDGRLRIGMCQHRPLGDSDTKAHTSCAGHFEEEDLK
jgi:hypothetical protein